MTPGYNQYQLIPDMLPSYIPLQLADKILFIGESWLLLKNNDDDSLLSINSIDYDEQNRLVQEQLHALILVEDLNMFELERIVERTRIDLSLTLRNLFVDRFHLCDELEQIRGFYLIERGELYTLFVHRTSQLLLNTKKSTNAIENDINEVFKQCLNDLHLESILTNAEKFKFKLNFPHNDNPTQVRTFDSYCFYGHIFSSRKPMLHVVYSLELKVHPRILHLISGLVVGRIYPFNTKSNIP
jgi:hypothetical protein